jgi:hypothetical protein
LAQIKPIAMAITITQSTTAAQQPLATANGSSPDSELSQPSNPSSLNMTQIPFLAEQQSFNKTHTPRSEIVYFGEKPFRFQTASFRLQNVLW